MLSFAIRLILGDDSDMQELFASSFRELGWWPLALFAVVRTVAVLVMVFGGRRADEERRKRFSGRSEITLEEFTSTCTEDKPLDHQLVSEFLQDMALAVGIPVGKLRPTDRFSGDLAPPKGWEIDDSIDPIIIRWMARGKKIHGAKPSKQLRDLNEFVCWACTRE